MVNFWLNHRLRLQGALDQLQALKLFGVWSVNAAYSRRGREVTSELSAREMRQGRAAAPDMTPAPSLPGSAMLARASALRQRQNGYFDTLARLSR